MPCLILSFALTNILKFSCFCIEFGNSRACLLVLFFFFEYAEFIGIDTKPYTFTELKSATRDFDPSNKLGEGGFGAVYKVIYVPVDRK